LGLFQVTRYKSEAASRRYGKNGYAPKPPHQIENAPNKSGRFIKRAIISQRVLSGLSRY
jgi:hypothetical protein